MDSCHPNAARTVASVTIVCTFFQIVGNTMKEKSKLSPRGRDVSVMLVAVWLQENF